MSEERSIQHWVDEEFSSGEDSYLPVNCPACGETERDVSDAPQVVVSQSETVNDNRGQLPATPTASP